jgi:hypothetical protein
MKSSFGSMILRQGSVVPPADAASAIPMIFQQIPPPPELVVTLELEAEAPLAIDRFRLRDPHCDAAEPTTLN